jgi:hypothetical protein
VYICRESTAKCFLPIHGRRLLHLFIASLSTSLHHTAT